MKKLLKLLFTLSILASCEPVLAQTINCSQIKKGFGITCGGSNLIVDTTKVATLYDLSQVTASATWGTITGTLSAQTDLQTALNAKLNISDTASMLSHYAELSELALKLNISDTAGMLSNYTENSETALKLNISDTNAMLSHYAELAELALKLNISDTAAMLSHFVEYGDTASMLLHYAELAELALKLNISDTAAMLANYVELSELNAKRQGAYFSNSLQATVTDAATYYAGNFFSDGWSLTTSGLRGLQIPYACTVTDVYLQFFTASVATTETFTVSLDLLDGAGALVSNTALFSAFRLGTNITYKSATGLSLAVTKGYCLQIKIVIGSAGTNPTNIRLVGSYALQ